MKQTKKTIVWLVAFLGISSIQVFGKPFTVGPYLGQTPPGSTAQVFAPGLICDTRPHQWEACGSFSADGNTYPGIAPDESFMVFTAIRPGGLGATDLYLTLRRPDGTWTEAQNMGPLINSVYFEFGARISSDKKYMFFTRANGWFENPYRDTSDIYWVELKEYLPETYR